MTSKQKEIISRNLQAFTHNFGEVRICGNPGMTFCGFLKGLPRKASPIPAAKAAKFEKREIEI